MANKKKLMDRITEKLGLYEEDEEDYLEEEESEEEEPVKKASPFKSRVAKPVEKPLPVREALPLEPEKPKKASLFSRKKAADDKKTINMELSKKQIKVVVIEPSSFDDSQKVADYLRNNQPVVVNFESADKVLKKRMTDFISGTIYALAGSVKKIGDNILVCAPKNVDIDAGAGAMYSGKGESKWKK